jgi:hypothetical protein
MPTKMNLMGAGCPALQAIASMGFVSNSLTAAGSTQGTALALPTDFNVFTTVAASTGGILPAAGTNYQLADTIIVVNHGANALTVYPQTGGKIGVASANTGLSVPSGKMAWFTVTDATAGANIWAASVSA